MNEVETYGQMGFRRKKDKNNMAQNTKFLLYWQLLTRRRFSWVKALTFTAEAKASLKKEAIFH
jgi:hypothetical protein